MGHVIWPYSISGSLLLVIGALASFDISDIENGLYHKVEITPTPISLKLDGDSVESELELVQLASVYGQLYSCSYKSPTAVLANQTSEPEKPWLHVNMTKNMAGYSDGTRDCFKATKGWWTYEVCPWQYVVQYHDDRDAKTSSGRSLLGLFGREFNWTNSTEDDIEVRKKYHSQQFENGTICDLTQKHRVAEVQYLCLKNDDLEDGIIDIQEPQTCSYIIQVHIHKLCQSAVFRRSKGGHILVDISCKPALSESQYERYLEREEKFKATEELIKKEKAKEQADADASAILEKELLKAFERLSADDETGTNEVDVEEPDSPDENDVKESFTEELAKVDGLRNSNTARLRSEMVKQFESIVDKAEKELLQAEENGDDPKAMVDRERALETLAAAMERILTKVEKGDPRVSAEAMHESDGEATSRHEALSEEEKAAEPVGTAEAGGIPGIELKLDAKPSERASITEAIKKELEKAGIKPGDRNVEIRVVTAPKLRGSKKAKESSEGEEDEQQSDDKATHLPANSGRVLGQMIAAVITSDASAVRTAFDQQNLENNYAMTFDEDWDNDSEGDGLEADALGPGVEDLL